MASVVDQIGARDLWDAGITGAGVNVAIIDTGIAPVPALTSPGKVVAAIDFSAERNDPALAGRDGYGHGTHLAGIIAGRDGDFLGVAPDAGIVSIKVAGRDGAVSQDRMVDAVDWVVANADALDIDVLTIAFDSGLGTSHATDPLAAALDRAWDAGIVVVTAAGNRGADARRSRFAGERSEADRGGRRRGHSGRLRRSRHGRAAATACATPISPHRAPTSAACAHRAARPTRTTLKVSSTTRASSAAARHSRQR